MRADAAQRRDGDPIDRIERVDEARGRIHRRPSLQPANVRLIDGHDHEPAGVDVFVRGEVPCRDRRAPCRRCGGIDELDGRHRPELPVHLEHEVGGPEAAHRPAVGANDGGVHGHEVDARAEDHVLAGG